MGRGRLKNLSSTDSRRRARQQLHLRDPQHRRRSAAGRSRRHARAVSQHRRPGRVRIQDAAASHCRGRARDARRPQRLRSVGRASRRRARRWRPSTRRAAFPVSPDRVFITAGTSEGHRARADALWSTRRRSARADADVSAVHGGARQDRRARALLPHGSRPRMDAGSRSPAQSRHARDARAGRHRSEQSDRRVLSHAVRRELLDFADRHGLAILADEVYGDLGFDGPVPPIGSLDPDAADHLVLEPVEGVSRPGWRTGWMGIGRSPRLDDVVAAVRQAGGRPAVRHRADAIRRHGGAHRRPVASARVSRRAEGARGHHRRSPDRDPRRHCVAPTAAFYAMPRSRCRPARPTRTTCWAPSRDRRADVYGSGFGSAEKAGSSASPSEAAPGRYDASLASSRFAGRSRRFTRAWPCTVPPALYPGSA